MRKILKRIISSAVAFMFIVFNMCFLCGCGKRSIGTVNIGVVRNDGVSDEALSWERYLVKMGNELDLKFDFTTVKSGEDEVEAINTYAEKGYDAIFLLSYNNIVDAVKAAENKKMYTVLFGAHPQKDEYEKIKNLDYYLGSVSPDDDTEYEAGYNMAKYFSDIKNAEEFTIYGGEIQRGNSVHLSRLSGMISYLCEDQTTSYDGVSKRADIAEKISTGFDISKFKSEKYKIAEYFDSSDTDEIDNKLIKGMNDGGIFILSVCSGKELTKKAEKIKKSSDGIDFFNVGGFEAVVSDTETLFGAGYSYNVGTYPSMLAPAIILTLSALGGSKISSPDANAPYININYRTSENKEDFLKILLSDNEEDGYLYDEDVIEHFAGNNYSEFIVLCEADFKKATAIKEYFDKK